METPNVQISAVIRKEAQEKPDTVEHWDKNNHLTAHNNQEINTSSLKKTEDFESEINHKVTSNVLTHHSNNDLGHEVVQRNTNRSDHMQSQGARKVKITTPTESSLSEGHTDRDTQINARGTERDQSLSNGSIHIESENATKQFKQHETRSANSCKHPDSTHITAERITYDNNETSNTTNQRDITRQNINTPHSKIQITDSNNVENKLDNSNHNTHDKQVIDTPQQHTRVTTTTDSTDSKDSTTTTETTNVVAENQVSTLQIIDLNNEKRKNETEKNKKEVEKLIDDKHGKDTYIKESSYKEVKDDTLENENTLTVNKIPKTRTGKPLKIIIKSSALDEQNLQTHSTDVKQILTTSPTEATIEFYNDEESSNYHYGPVNAANKDSHPVNIGQNNNSKGKSSLHSNDKEKQSDNTDEHKSTGQNSYGTMLLLMPEANHDDTTPSNFINSAMQSDTMKSLLQFLKNNNMSSNIMLAGPINSEDPKNLFNRIKENVKSEHPTLGIAELSISEGTKISEIHEVKIPEKNTLI